eukprot:6174172-Pleurochrysis_carterae.AAC.1
MPVSRIISLNSSKVIIPSPSLSLALKMACRARPSHRSHCNEGASGPTEEQVPHASARANAYQLHPNRIIMHAYQLRPLEA